MEALAARADVKARAQDKARQQTRQQPIRLAAPGAVVAVVLGLLVIKQSRRR